MKEVTGRYRQC